MDEISVEKLTGRVPFLLKDLHKWHSLDDRQKDRRFVEVLFLGKYCCFGCYESSVIVLEQDIQS